MEFIIGLLVGAAVTWYLLVRPGKKSLTELKKQQQDYELKLAKTKVSIEILEKSNGKEVKK